jgi:hypothetical protein
LAYEEDRTLLEEHAIAEHRGMLGGKRIEATQEGKLERTTFLMTCDYCGKFPLETFVFCSVDKLKLCTECAMRVDGRPYCRTHLTEVLPLSRNGYKILLCFKAEIESLSKISKICRLDKDAIKSSLAVLAETKYIAASGLLAFLSRKITADGIRVLSIYSKIFDPDEDVADVKSRLQEEDQDGT